MVSENDPTTGKDSSVSVYEKCVVKLALDGVGDAHIFRRVRLTAPSSTYSPYRDLKKRVMHLASVQLETRTADQILLIYTDLEADKILIASDEDLEDAMEQYSAAGTLKVFATLMFSPKVDLVLGGNSAVHRVDTVTESPPCQGYSAVKGNEGQPVQHVHVSPPPCQGYSAVKGNEGQNEANDVAEQFSKAVAAADAAAAASTSATTPTVQTPVRPFIHGRHTCDACLTTPIVGERYHAVNLPDYDLCKACNTNYKGHEIQFEVAQLDRDGPYQDRWNRRRTKWQHRHTIPQGSEGPSRRGHGSFRGHPGLGSFRGNRFGTRFHGGGHGRRNCHPAGGLNRAHEFAMNAQQLGLSQLAVAEAIRQSLKDLGRQSSVKSEASAKTVPSGAENPASKEEPVAPPAYNEFTEKAADASTATKVSEPSAPTEEQVKQAPNDSFESDAAGSGDIAAALGETLDKFAKAIEAVSLEFDRTPVVQDCGDEDDDDDDDDEEDIVVEVVNATFAPDTEDQGTTIIDGPDDIVDDASHDSWQVVVEDQQIAYDEAVARAAQLIGSAMFNSDMANSAEDVSVLSPSGGSAEAMSIATSTSSSFASASSGTTVSSATSVPTIVPSLASGTVVAAVQLERWAPQLHQLRELGFHNDALSVDIIERLNAANIGVDSTEEVSVTQVVNELMKDW